MSSISFGLPPGFERAVQRHLDGLATADDQALLETDRRAWSRLLLRKLDDTEVAYDDLRDRVRGPERALVLADYESEIAAIERALDELLGPVRPAGQAPTVAPADVDLEPGVTQLQLSWVPGRIVAWSGGFHAPSDGTDGLLARLAAAGASTTVWKPHAPAKLPDGSTADAVSAPLDAILGWLVSLRLSHDDPDLGVGATWLGMIGSLAVQLVSQGRMIPKLKKLGRADDAASSADRSSFAVHWAPALMEPDDIVGLSKALPQSVTVFRNRQDARAFSQAVLADLVDVIVSTGARRLELPAASPEPRTKPEVAEAMLGHINGRPFEAPTRVGAELARRLDQWSRPISGAANVKLVIMLDEPDSSGSWYLRVMAPGNGAALEPIESAMVNSSNTRRKDVKDQMQRLEALYPVLLRPGGRRRGEVILSQDEAWQLMTSIGDTLTAAGFEVRAPALSRKKPSPALRLTSEEAQESVVGARQLANVRWSVLFDDVELTAADISRLAAQARPLVMSNGKWVELSKVDLAQAARALADRAQSTKLSGADMLRHALGLEGSPLSGGISVAGEGWAADLLRSASSVPTDLPTKPEGFRGELRHYQAEALAWLGFLDTAGLGGCLALDMGLGKTPTMLAHLRRTVGSGPALVIAPPAVVGNWASEARKFVPELRVLVHHGPNRAEPRDIAKLPSRADVVITTYGTAVRDAEALARIEWGQTILDEAQAIKNATSETAQVLRTIPARSRVALTGTPIENGLGDLWSIMDYTNPGLVGNRAQFISQLSPTSAAAGGGAEGALRALNGILVFRRTKAEPAIAAELPDRIDELDHCSMTAEQIGLYQAVLDNLIKDTAESGVDKKKGAVLAAITALKQICNHPAAYRSDDRPLEGRSGKLSRLNEIVDNVFAAGERVLIFTHFATWGQKLATYQSERTGLPIACYHGGLGRTARDALVRDFQNGTGPGAMVLSLKAGGTGLNLTAANHVVLYDRWWNPAVEDQARDRVWRIGQKNTVIAHRLVCPGTVDERVEEVVAGKRQIADLVLPKSSSIDDLDAAQLQAALGIDESLLLAVDDDDTVAPVGPVASRSARPESAIEETQDDPDDDREAVTV